MTNDEIVEKLKLIKIINSEIQDLVNQRTADELAIVTEYKVKECNDKRSSSSIFYQDQIILLEMQRKSIESEIKEALI